MNKRYYWLKLKDNFFQNARIKKLRNIAGGDTYTIIYLKLQLLSLQDEGKIYYEEIEDTFEKEIALKLDEDIENVIITIQYLLSSGLMTQDEDKYVLNETMQCIGSETDSSIRSRKSREIKKNETLMLQCNTLATKCNIEKEIEKEIDIDIKKKNISNDILKKNCKKKYGKYKRILLTDNEYQKLCDEFTKDFINKQIELLDEYVESNNNKNKYKNFNLVLRKSIRENWFKKNEKQSNNFMPKLI